MPNTTPAVCPFFLRERTKAICCEGLADGVETIVEFGDGKCKRQWFDQYCRKFRYTQCPYAQAAVGNYKDSGLMENNEKSSNSIYISAKILHNK